MTNINLLPWRALARQQKASQFWRLFVGGFIMACCGVFIVNGYFTHQLQQQEKKNQKLKFNLTQVRHAQRMAKRAPHRAHFLMSLEGWIPPGIHLKRVEEQEDEVILWGVAQSPHAIVQLMKTLKKAGAVTHQPLMTEPTKQAFSLRVLLSEPKS